MERNLSAGGLSHFYEVMENELVEIVFHIESQFPTTQNRYGAYLASISSLQIAFKSVGISARSVGDLLVKAGGDATGIKSALQVMGS